MSDEAGERTSEPVEGLRELALVEEAARLLASSRDLADVHAQIVRAAALILSRTSHAWRASYLVLEGSVLHVAAVHDPAGLDLGTREYPLADYPTLRHVVEGREATYGSAPALSAGIPDETMAVVQRAELASAAMFPLVIDGTVAGVIGVSSREPVAPADIPMQRLAAIARLAELAISNARLVAEEKAVAARARTLDEAKSRFLNLAAHEMRGPVTVIRGYASMLSDGDFGHITPAAAAGLSNLAAKTDELRRLIDLLLEAARIDEGRIETSGRRLDLRHATAAALEAARSSRHDNNVRLDLAPEPLWVVGDRDRLTAAIAHLVDNAVKFSPAGSPVDVRCSREDALAVVTVTDRGIGLSVQEQAALFSRFGRVVSERTSHIPGFGLGLWYARAIAHLHGGDIDISSELERGSVVRLTLPAAIVPAPGDDGEPQVEVP